ncbi:MAG TPA: hypothetical protein VFJ55_01305 [Chthoniobacterales bacterium]|nr:hypothetical protein [Chthoniobacterales bacterium]
MIRRCSCHRHWRQSRKRFWDDVRENPVRAGLVASSDAWEYQGEIATIDRV